MTTLPPFLQGVLHPLLMPALLLAMLGLGLLLGQQDKPVRLRSLPLAIVTFIAGLILAQYYPPPAGADRVLIVIAVLTAGLSALQPSLPGWLPSLFAVVCGLLIGVTGAPPTQEHLLLTGVAFTGSILMLSVIVFGCLLHRLLHGKGGLALGVAVAAGAILLGLLRH